MIRIEVESKKTKNFGKVVVTNYKSEGNLGDLVQELSDLIVGLQENVLADILTPVKDENFKKEIKEEIQILLRQYRRRDKRKVRRNKESK